MAKVTIQPFEAVSKSAGAITIAYSNSVAGNFIRIGISKAAQELYFGGQLDPKDSYFDLDIDDAPDRCKHAVLTLRRPGTEDTLGASSAAFGVLALKLVPWVAPRDEKVKSQPMAVEQIGKGAVRLTLPAWAQPGPKNAPRKIGEGKSILDELPMRK